MDGLELSRRVYEKYPDTLVIVFSAYSEFDFAKQALEAGVMHYLLKPVEIVEFKKCMEAALERLENNKSKTKQQEICFMNRKLCSLLALLLCFG